MIIWKGWGILLVVVGAASLILTEVMVEGLFRDDAYFQDHAWPLLLAFLLAAAVVWPLGNYLNGRGRTLVDPETGQEIVVGGDHSFFFIKLQYWAPILVAVGLLIFFS